MGVIESDFTHQDAKLVDGRPFESMGRSGSLYESSGEPDVRAGRITYEMTIRFQNERDWANDLIAKMGELQNEDGSFRSIDDRWMENNPVLITAYSLIALQHAIN